MKQSPRLPLSSAMREGLAAENKIVVWKGSETLIGLTRDETERLLSYWQASGRTPRENRQDRIYVEERHHRAAVWWQRALHAPESVPTVDMTPEAAFEAGQLAWDGQRARADLSAHMQDFDGMIARVPGDLRLAAVHGWLSAFDDEADRIRASSGK